MGLPRWFSSTESTSMQETQEMLVQSLGQEDPLEEGMATYSSIHGVAKSHTGLCLTEQITLSLSLR